MIVTVAIIVVVFLLLGLLMLYFPEWFVERIGVAGFNEKVAERIGKILCPGAFLILFTTAATMWFSRSWAVFVLIAGVLTLLVVVFVLARRWIKRGG